MDSAPRLELSCGLRGLTTGRIVCCCTTTARHDAGIPSCRFFVVHRSRVAVHFWRVFGRVPAASATGHGGWGVDGWRGEGHFCSETDCQWFLLEPSRRSCDAVAQGLASDV